MDGRGATPANPANAGSSRLVWRLFSPSFRVISCQVSKDERRFRLTVAARDQVLTSCEAEELEALHARASEWRAQLESHGYVSADRVRHAEPRSAAPRCETRTAFLGLLECAALMELQRPDVARRLRDRATEGLVAVSLSDAGMIADTIASTRALLAQANEPDLDRYLILSCISLLDRIDSTTPNRPSAEIS